MIRFTHVALLALLAPLCASAQQRGDQRLSSASRVAPPAALSDAPEANTLEPSWETRKQARTYLFSIPAPRGQIVDRNGNPLAQSRVSYNLGVSFETPFGLSDVAVRSYVQQQADAAQALLGRPVNVSMTQAVKHYQGRGMLPLTIVQDLKPSEVERIQKQDSKNLVLQPTYQRFYPNGALAGHVIGYAGRSGRQADGPVQNGDFLWPAAEGRDGLEQSFNEQLQGKNGQLNMAFDAKGVKASEQVVVPPQPGYNVVTTIDAHIQELCEQSLAKGTKRGAIVVIDPNNGDILALASWPTLNPNDFIPNISSEKYKELQDDSNIPLLPRAFRSAYPPGSCFKVFVGLAAMNTGRVSPDDEFSCPGSMQIGNLTFRNWKKGDSGSMNFADALMQSCNTWFYQCGMKIGPGVIYDYASRVGLGVKTGIPLASEAEGRVMNDEYMVKTYKRHMYNGDVANLSIGQGDTLVTPLQMAQAMAVVGNGGTLYQTRLVSQVQSIDGKIVTGYNVRARGQIDINDDALKALRIGLVQVVEGRAGTAGRAQVDGIHIGGKTGTAQWGPKNKERTAAWFAGVAPVKQPRYAFAALYEGEADNDEIHGGTYAAPLIGRVMKELFRDESKGKKKGRGSDGDDEDLKPTRKPRGEGDEPVAAPVVLPAEPVVIPAPRPARRPLFPVRPTGH